MGNVPMVSVLMPVYNGEQWLDAAIKSILMQSYSDVELLILLEYGSSEKSRGMVYGYTDRRIRVSRSVWKSRCHILRNILILPYAVLICGNIG